MIRFAIRTVWSLVVLGVLVYCTFFVPLGSRTLFEHVARIARTDEARDLGREVGEATSRAGDALAREIREGAVADGAPVDPEAGRGGRDR